MTEAEAAADLRPLDEQFVANLTAVTGSTNLSIHPRSENHFWRDQLRSLRQQGLSNSDISAFFAERFSSGAWTDENAPTSSDLIMGVFAGYDRTRTTTPPGTARRPAYITPDRTDLTALPTPSTAGDSQGSGRRRLSLPSPSARATVRAQQQGEGLASPAETEADGRRRSRSTGPTSRPATVRSRVRVAVNDVPDVDPAWLPPPPGGQQTQAAQDDSVPAPGMVDAQDFNRSHTFEGQLQPSVGARVQQANNWATDEDIDRRRGFTREKEEVKRWLEHVDREHAHALGGNTLRKIDELKRKIEAHDLFEQHHRHTTMRTKISIPEDMKTRKQRIGNPNGADTPPIQLGSFDLEARNAKLMPEVFRGHPRPGTRVSKMWDTHREAALDFNPRLHHVRQDRVQALRRDEVTYWQMPLGTAPPEGNLSVTENQAYEDCKAANGGLNGWVYWDKTDTGEVRRLWNGAKPGNGEGCFANERGARRAGLEAALRVFRNTENLLYASKSYSLVALPPSAGELAAERRKAGADRGRLLDIRSLPPHQLGKTQGKDDPQGFIANMAQFWVRQKALVEKVRENVIVSLAKGNDPPGNKTFVKPPNSVWGPYVWRGVSMGDELQQDLLRQSRAVKSIFDRERQIAPRQLLEDMNHFYNQGYTTQVDEPWYLPGAGDGVTNRRLNLNGNRNRHPNTGRLRRVDMVEMEWIRLILNNAMADARVLKDVQPRTSLFLLFAEKLECIFDDLSSPLFPDQDTSVSVETLIDYMAANMHGPIKQPKFYPYDVKAWLERLNEQGRCRFRDDWRTYGLVQRPEYKYFPEQLIVWKDRLAGEVDVQKFPEDAIYAPRFSEDLGPWQDVVIHVPPQRLNPAVETWFHQVAFRWGRTMRSLDNLEIRTWKDDMSVWPQEKLDHVLDELDTEYQAIAAPQKLDLATVVRRTLGKDESVAMSEDDALQTIRNGIIDECVRSDGLLYPGRATDYLDTSASALRTRESIWDWAKPEVRGPVKRFFSLNRWPVEIQPEAIRHRIENSEDTDQQQIWNPVTEDPTPWTYYRPKARPYQDEPIRYKEGHRRYLIGDSARQQQFIKDTIVARVATGMGLVDEHGNPIAQLPSDSGGVWSRMRALGGVFNRKRQRAHDADDDDDDGDDGDFIPKPKLPRIDPTLVPHSVDREQAEAVQSHPPSRQPSEEARRVGDRRNPNLMINVSGRTEDDI